MKKLPKIGSWVRVERIVDWSMDSTLLNQVGKVIYYRKTPDENLIGVKFFFRTAEFWKEELEDE